MSPQPQPSPTDQYQVVVEPVGPGEWIVTLPEGARSLHVYELGAADWLVSEVGRGSEGRGTDVKRALQALSTGAPAPTWWASVPDAVDEGTKSSRGGG
ncbi:MAG TPA: hypothetical protein VEF89_19735 [Solirubrobacteraceae bacterium]|nr:hypothetical protein [Solirubrobacteraceae bacterium]